MHILTQKTLSETGGNSIEWLDFYFANHPTPLKDDREFVGLEFLSDENALQRWKSFWPQSGNAQNWDAVGKINYGNREEWVLVEAKAHLGEIESDCGASNPASKQKIRSALQRTSLSFGNHDNSVENWLSPYYQYANRLAVLNFLMKECSPVINARLLFIYFYGDQREIALCPQNEQGWLPALQKMNDRLCINKSNELSQRIHYLFLPVNPNTDKEFV